MSPDIDSITSVWLIRKFFPEWSDAELRFVPAGSTLDNKPVDSDPDVIHVDTGFGRFDHHQTSDHTSASMLIFKHLQAESLLKERQSQALEKMIKEITNFDHFGEVFFPDPSSDHYEFMIHKIIEGGLKTILKEDFLITQSVFPFLDALLNIFMKKNQAVEEIKKGFVFTSHWGKTLIMETRNEETAKLAMKMGYTMVVKKDPDRGNVPARRTPGGLLEQPLQARPVSIGRWPELWGEVQVQADHRVLALEGGESFEVAALEHGRALLPWLRGHAKSRVWPGDSGQCEQTAAGWRSGPNASSPAAKPLAARWAAGAGLQPTGAPSRRRWGL